MLCCFGDLFNKYAPHLPLLLFYCQILTDTLYYGHIFYFSLFYILFLLIEVGKLSLLNLLFHFSASDKSI